MFTIQQLQQLAVIGELGTLSAAAEQLHLSQPALSRSMQRLEEELGLTLFERRRNRIILRELGQRAVNGAKQLLQDAEDYARDLRDYAARLSLVLVGASSPAPMWRLSTELCERFPELTVAEELRDAELLLTGLREGRYRLVLTHVPFDEEGILCRKYAEERLLLELPADHELSGQSGLTPEMLRGSTVLTLRNIGAWQERFSRFKGVHFIEQSEIDVLEDLVLSLQLPLLTSSMGASRTATLGGRISLPILSEDAVLPFYLCARESDQDLLSQLC